MFDFSSKQKSEQKNYEIALIDYTDSIELNPNFTLAYQARADLHESQKKYELALADYSKVIELEPDSIEAYNNRANCYRKQKNYELALADYTKAIELEPDSITAYHNRANFYKEQKKYELALIDFNTAIELEPNNANAYSSRASYYEEQENYELALADYTTVIELKPYVARNYRNRADYYTKQKNHELALIDYAKANELEPDEIWHYITRLDLYLEQKNYELALVDYIKAIKLENGVFSRTIKMLFYKITDNFILNYIDNAIKSCDSLEDKRAYSFLASDIACIQKEFDKSEEYMKQAFEYMDLTEQNHKDVYLKEIRQAKEIDKKNTELEEKNKELEEKNQQLQAKEKELEDMMSMFAHKFRSPLDAIIYNTSHENNPKLYAEAAQTMRGLLDIFSIISTDDKILTDKIKTDNQGNSRLITVLDKTLNMLLLHLLSVSGADKIQQHYLAYAKAHGKIEESVNYKTWCDDYFELEQQLQAEWEQSFSALLNQSAPLEQRLNWLEQHFFKLEIIGFDRDDIQFKDYAITESLLIILINEILVNAFKYYSSETKQPVILQWAERDGYQVLTCHNPSIRRERTTIKGSGKGHTFLSALARKTGSQFTKPKPQDDFVLEFAIPNELLISNSGKLMIINSDV